MYKGYYNAVSGMLTQQRVLNTIGNNLTNAGTAGFKKDTTTSITFNDVLAHRLGNVDKDRPYNYGVNLSSIRTVDTRETTFTQGGLDPTGRNLDFAIAGDGFFEIATADGNVYTRNGSFTLDEEGYLYLAGGGRVMGTGGAINLGTDQFSVSANGTITREDGSVAGQVRVVDFADYEALDKNDLGFFVAEGAGAQVNGGDVIVYGGVLETSNVVAANETVSMIEAQRAFQSCSQVFQIYNAMNDKAEEIAKL